MTFQELVKNLTDMELLYGEKVILNVIDEKNKYSIKEIVGNQCARYFEPSDGVSEVTIIIKRKIDLYEEEMNKSLSSEYKLNELHSKLDKAIEQMIEEKEAAYADFDEYKRNVLGVDDIDDLPNDDFRYGMERCIEILKRNIRE